MLDNDILSRHWFVIQAAPSREHDAAQILRDRGSVVYQPTELRKHRPNRHAKRRWWYSMPLFSRYLLAGFDRPTPPWFDLLEHSSIAGVVDYRPLRRMDMLKLILDYGADGLEPPRARRYRTNTGEIVEGASVLILNGPYNSHTAKVASIVPARGGRKAKAAIILPVLGSGRTVELALDDLELEEQIAA